MGTLHYLHNTVETNKDKIKKLKGQKQPNQWDPTNQTQGGGKFWVTGDMQNTTQFTSIFMDFQ